MNIKTRVSALLCLLLGLNILAPSAHAQSREYFCTATDAILLDFLSDPRRPLYMQRVDPEIFNVKLTRENKKVQIKDVRGLTEEYPMLQLGYGLTSVKDFFVAAEGRAYFEYRDGLAVHSHGSMIVSYKCEGF